MPLSYIFVEPEKVYMAPKINQRVQIHKIFLCSTNSEMFYLKNFSFQFVVCSGFGRIYFIFCAMIAFTYTYRVKTSLVKWWSVSL